MDTLPRISVADVHFAMDILTADVTHVLYRGERPQAGPCPYQDLPNYLLHFKGRGELDSDMTVYLNVKVKPGVEPKGLSRRHFDQGHERMVSALSKALNGDLIEHPQRGNLQTLALINDCRPVETASFNPVNVPQLPVVILNNDVARISIFAKGVHDPLLARGKLSDKIYGLAGWAGFEGFFEINGNYTGLASIINREELVQSFYNDLIATWPFLLKLGFWMVELNQLKSLENIDEIATYYSSTAQQVNPCRINHAQSPVVEVWRDVNLGFVFSYLLLSVPAHQLAKAVRPLFNAWSTDEPLVDVTVLDEGRTVSLTLSSYSVKDDDQKPEAVVVSL